MIRFILEKHYVNYNEGVNSKSFITLDIDLPELESLLKSGGSGEVGFEHTTLSGIELLQGGKDE